MCSRGPLVDPPQIKLLAARDGAPLPIKEADGSLSEPARWLIGGLVHRAVGRRRGKWTWLAAGAGIIVGALGALSLTLFLWRFDLISALIYAVMATGAAVGVLRMGGRRR